MTDSPILHEALFKQLEPQLKARGQLVMPCVPSLLEYYLQQIKALFDSLNLAPDPETLSKLPHQLKNTIEEGFETSPHSKLILKYEPTLPPKNGLTLNLSTFISSVADQYKDWVKHREPPLFGSHPDAKVMEIAAQLGDRPNSPILDIGAGTGRNTIPLAKLGYPVDAVELAPVFVEQLEAAAQAENLPVRTILGDILDRRQMKLRPAYYRFALLSEVVASHFGEVDRLRLLLAKMSDTLCVGGWLLFSIFLTVEEYEPDRLTREMSQVIWSCIFTRKELGAAMENLPLTLISDESVLEYERSRLPITAWPPTGWFINWTQGQNLFPLQEGKPPMELRWILCQRV